MISLEPGWMTKFYDHGTDKQWEITRFHMPHYRSKPHPESFITALKRYGFKLKLWLCVDYDLTAEEERIVKGEDTCDRPRRGSTICARSCRTAWTRSSSIRARWSTRCIPA